MHLTMYILATISLQSLNIQNFLFFLQVKF